MEREKKPGLGQRVTESGKAFGDRERKRECAYVLRRERERRIDKQQKKAERPFSTSKTAILMVERKGK